MPKKKTHTVSEETELDKIDCQIINMLQEDGRYSNTVIAKELGIAEATVRARVKRLIKEDYIRILAVSNPSKLGFAIQGNLKIRIEKNKKSSIVKKLSNLKEVVFMNLMTGSMDIDIDFLVKSLDELNDLLYNKIARIDGLITTETSVVLENIKEDYAWGTAFDDE